MKLDTCPDCTDHSMILYALVALIFLYILVLWLLTRSAKNKNKVGAKDNEAPEPLEFMPTDPPEIEPALANEPQSAESGSGPEFASPIRDDASITKETIKNLVKDTTALDKELLVLKDRFVSNVYVAKGASQTLGQYLIEHVKELGFVLDNQETASLKRPVSLYGEGTPFMIDNVRGSCVIFAVSPQDFGLIVSPVSQDQT